MVRAKSEPEGTVRWGLYGGTFNPIHHGHLITALQTTEQLNFDRLLFIPSHIPPHRENPDTSAEIRLKMTQEAVYGYPPFDVTDTEIQRNEPSYSIETVQKLENKHPEIEFHLVVGLDELVQFDQWHQWRSLLDKVQIVGMSRPGYNFEDVPEQVRSKSTHVKGPTIELSSSQIRKRVREGKTVRYMVPESVRDVISEHQLYRE